MKKVHATATPNIALIKYWGNRNNELRLPAADSLSMTLDRPSLTLSLEESDQFSLTSFLNGEKKDLKPEDQRRRRQDGCPLWAAEAEEAEPRRSAAIHTSRIPQRRIKNSHKDF
jgi:hypothetical protein